MLRYGILGFGLHGERRLMPGFTHARRSCAVAFWRNNQARAADTASHYNLKSYATPQELCAAPEVDAVFVTSPDALHAEHAELALRCGKPVLCEKPMAMNATECERMMRASESADRLLGVAHVFRFEESVRKVREIVSSGRLGRLLGARLQFVHPGVNSPRTWITDRRLAAGGPTADVGVHCFDTLRYIFRAEPVALSAEMLSDKRSGDVEFAAEISVRFDNDVLASVFVSTRAAYRTDAEIIGSERVLTAKCLLTTERPVEVVVAQDGEIEETFRCDNRAAYGLQFDAFADAVSGAAPFPCTAQDGLQNQRMIDAAYESAQSKSIVKL